MSREYTEIDLYHVAIDEDLTDDEGDTKHNIVRASAASSHTTTTPTTGKKKRRSSKKSLTGFDGSNSNSTLTSKEKRRRRIKRMGAKAASLKFSAVDFVALSPDKLKKHYTLGKLLHRGSNPSSKSLSRINSYGQAATNHSTTMEPHANIHHCLHKDTNQQRAVKVVKKTPRWNRAQNQILVREFKILQHLDHPNLIRAYELFEGREHFYIIMDLCEGGDLGQELDAWGRLQEEDAAILIKQLLNVINYLHSNRIVHGNIKPEHILLEHDKDLDHIKLTDFSCAEIMEPDDDADDDDDDNNGDGDGSIEQVDVDSFFHDTPVDDSSSDTDDDDDSEEASALSGDKSNNNISKSGSLKRGSSGKSILPERKGTPDYWAPEVVLKGSCGPKRDVWACGVLCYLCLSNSFPFKGNTREEICEKIIRGDLSFGEEEDEEEDDDGYGNDDYGYGNSTSIYDDYLEEGGPSPADAEFDWGDVSDLAKSFMRQLLTYEEGERPTAKKALEHPWIVKMTSPEKKEERTGDRFTLASSPGRDFVNSMATMAAWNNVSKFNASSKLKQATLTLIAAQMVLKEERKAIDHVFRSLDSKNDGRLSRDEVKAGYKECFNRELTEAELDDLFNRVDLNKTGHIEYSEFVVAAMNETDLLHREKVKQAFSVFDRDHSGVISKENLKEVLTHFKGGAGALDEGRKDLLQNAIDDEAIEKIMKQADATGSGDITYDEFMAMMLKTTDEIEDEEGYDDEVTPLHSPERAPVKRETTGMSIDSACTAANMSTLRFTTHDFVAQRQGELTAFYEIEDFIDEGGFGKVFVCKHKATSSERALKVIDKSRWKKDENSRVLNEFQILKGLAHPNMIRFYDLFEDQQHFYVVMDICKGGDLCDELITWGKLSEQDASMVITQVLSCLNYCHHQKVIHRDMKPDNILLEQNKDLKNVKLIDFGFATHFEDGVEMTQRVGTAQYMAPEVVNRSYFGSSCDIWSVGVICYVILSNKYPFKGGKTREALYESIVNGKFSFPSATWGNISQEAKDFIEMLLIYDPKERPTAEKALLHPWLEAAKAPRRSTKLNLDNPQDLDDLVADTSAMMALSNLQSVSSSKLKEAVKTFIASQLLLAEEKRAIDDVFRELDLTRNGKLSKSEVQAAYFKYFGYSLGNEELERLFQRCDPSGDGFIQYSEFVVATMNESVLLGRQKLKKAFELFDSDGNGLISASDLKQAFSAFSPDNVNATDDRVILRLIKQVDADGDGLISYDEFVGLMMLSADDDLKL